MPKEQWPALYYLLAALNLFTILAGLLFYHFLLGLNTRSVEINGEWLQRFERFERLAESMGHVNEPGNDIFQSHRVRAERLRLQRELVKFNSLLKQLQEEDTGLAPVQQKLLKNDYSSIEQAMREMVSEAEIIFSRFERGNALAAGLHMASMDRNFGTLNKRMALLRRHAREFQKNALVEQRNKARALGYLELLFTALVFTIIGLASFYGYEMSKRFRVTRKIIEEQRINIQASAKLSALGEMAGGIAHEINNPLAIIQMRAVHLREMQERGHVDEKLLVETTEAIERTSDRIASIIRGLRTFARDARRDPFRKESVGKVIEETLSICRERFHQRHIRLEVASNTADLAIECRATEISQVLLNLLSNAADAVAGLAGAWVTIEAHDLGDAVQIYVTDSGRGIPFEIREKMMQPFFTTKEVGKGTGLGLSISKGIVESHQGKLWYDPSAGNTRFIIQLPKGQGLPRTRTA